MESMEAAIKAVVFHGRATAPWVGERATSSYPCPPPSRLVRERTQLSS